MGIGPLRRHRVLFALAGGLAVALGIGAGAIAATAKLKAVTASVSVPPQRAGAPVAKCPKGHELVSAGFSTPSFDQNFDEGPSILPVRLQKTSRRVVRARSLNFSLEGAGTFRAHAYCSKRKLGISVVSKRSAPLPGTFRPGRPATARCPAGSAAVAGGFRGPATFGEASPRVVPYVSRRKGKRSWTVAAINDGSAAARFRVFAVCAKKAPQLVERSRTVTIGPGTIGAARVGCKRGTTPFSGGYRSPVKIVDESAVGAFAFTSRRAGKRRWRSAFYAVEGGTTRATVIAYCAS